MIGSPWVIILAGGAGRRLAEVTGDVPKQFFRLPGRSSLFEQTVGRFRGLASAERSVAVVDRSHRGFIEDVDPGLSVGKVLYQPGDRGTAAGVFLGLSAVLERDPGAYVLLTPADHAVGQPAVFRSGIQVARRNIRSGRADVVLFGAEPDHPSQDFGWIRASRVHSGAEAGVRSVDTFVEKPSPEDARRLLKAGAVWNTMVLLARARALESLFVTHTPELAAVFGHARKLPASLRAGFLHESYRDLPAPGFFAGCPCSCDRAVGLHLACLHEMD